MKLYTRTGDRGETGLFGGARVKKSDPRVDAYGEVDELNCVLGVARAQGLPAALDALLAEVQADLFAIGAQLATAPGTKTLSAPVGAERVSAIERAIDDSEGRLPELENFILPGGSPVGAMLHVARAVCRRAERRVVGLGAPDSVIVYLNRLSDLLFSLARQVNRAAGAEEVQWKGR